MKIIEEQIDKNNLRITIAQNELSTDEYYISTRSKTDDEIHDEKLKLIDRLNTSSIKYLDSKESRQYSLFSISSLNFPRKTSFLKNNSLT